MAHLPGWKSQYGEVFYLERAGTSGYVLRTFKLCEFEAFQAQTKIDLGYAEQHLLQACLLWPIDFDWDDPKFTEAEFQWLLANLHAVSPYDNSERFMAKLKEKRERSESLIDAIYIHIAAAFPSMKLADIQELSCDAVLHHLALSEKILQRELEIEGQGRIKSEPTIVDPKAARAQRHHARMQKREQAIVAGRAREAGLESPPEVVDDSGPQRLSILKDMKEMSRALGPPRD